LIDMISPTSVCTVRSFGRIDTLPRPCRFGAQEDRGERPVAVIKTVPAHLSKAEIAAVSGIRIFPISFR
jgi:hypothetical protein